MACPLGRRYFLIRGKGASLLFEDFVHQKMSGNKADGNATQPTFALNRKITGVFDNDVESPPGSPQDAVRKKPQVSSESDNPYLLFATPSTFTPSSPCPPRLASTVAFLPLSTHLSCLCALDSPGTRVPFFLFVLVVPSHPPQASRRVSGLWDSSVEAGNAGHRMSIDAQERKNEGLSNENNVRAVLNTAVESDAPIPNIVKALVDHPDNRQMQWMGIEALANMAPGNAQARKEIADNGGPSLVVAAMARYPEDEKVQAKGCWAMANGTQDQEDIWVSQGCISALTRAVDHASDCASKEGVSQKQYDSAASRFMIASRAFKNLINTTAAAEDALKCDTPNVLKRGVDVFKKDPMAQWRGDEAIGKITGLLDVSKK